MSGDPIESVRQGVHQLLTDLRTDPQALETAYLSVITFASDAQQVCPLTELMRFHEPPLEASGSTSLGAALRLLEQSIDREVRKSTATQKGDWKPLIFLMTDGHQTILPLHGKPVRRFGQGARRPPGLADASKRNHEQNRSG